MIIPILLILLCCVIIWRASDGFEAASEYLGRNLNDGVRGATINAIGSSMPELFTTMWFLFALHDKDGFAGGIGTTAGSAIFNGMIIPAVVILAVIGYGLAKRINVSKKVILRDGLSLIAAEFILIFLISGDTIEWWHGLILMGVYGLYVTVMLTTMSANEEGDDDEEEDEDDEEEDEGSTLKNLLTLNLEPVFFKNGINTGSAWTLLLVAMAVIGGACALLVHACENLGTALNIPIYFIAVVIASAATSVPDTILSYRDAMAGEYDDAVANALGSNIFDICFALGFPVFVYTLIYGPIGMSPETIENITELRGLLLVLTVFAFFIYFIGQGMGRVKAYLLLLIYIGFTAFIMGKAYDAQWALDIGEAVRSVFDLIL